MVTAEQQEEAPSFTCLTKLKIWNCPKLTSMPLFNEVLDLDLRNVNQTLLDHCKNTIMAIQKKNKNKTRNKKLNDGSKIQHLQIKKLHHLKNFKAVREGLGGLPSLKQLVIERCNELSFLVSEHLPRKVGDLQMQRTRSFK